MPEKAQTGFVRPRQLAPPEPPACPQGWVTAPPDFVGVGAQRSGTTWWHRQLILHPQVTFVNGTHLKEVHYFDSLAGVDELSSAQVEQYARYFPRPPGQVAGEWTPRYLLDPWVVPQLAQAAPGTRVLVMLRDPVERYLSGVRWQSRQLAGRPGRRGLTLDKIVELQRSRGFYGEQLGRVLDCFPREQILILQYERCRDRYEDELARTYEFLGVERSFRPVQDGNVPESPIARELPEEERAEVARLYAPDVRRLIEIAPEIDVSLWRNVRDLV